MVERANGQGNGDPFVHVRRLARSRLPNQRMVGASSVVWLVCSSVRCQVLIHSTPLSFQAAALLTAVEQTIAERGLEPTPTAYFASLVCTSCSGG